MSEVAESTIDGLVEEKAGWVPTAIAIPSEFYIDYEDNLNDLDRLRLEFAQKRRLPKALSQVYRKQNWIVRGLRKDGRVAFYFPNGQLPPGPELAPEHVKKIEGVLKNFYSSAEFYHIKTGKTVLVNADGPEPVIETGVSEYFV